MTPPIAWNSGLFNFSHFTAFSSISGAYSNLVIFRVEFAKGSVKYSVFRPRCFSRIWTLSSRQIEKRILMGFLFSKSTTSTFLCSGHEKWPILENATTNPKNEDDITFLMIWSIFEPNMMVIRRDFMWNDSTLMNHILSEFCANTRAQSAINISNVKQ